MAEWDAADTLFYLGVTAGGVMGGLGVVEIIRFYVWLRHLRRLRQGVSAHHGSR